MAHLLELSDVSFSYHTPDGKVPVLSHLSFCMDEGEFAAIVGSEGCGKSTLLNLVCGMLTPTSGCIRIKGQPLKDSHMQIGCMLQRDQLFEWRTVYSNVLLGLEIQNRILPEKTARVRKMMESCGLESYGDARPSQLSDSMRQKAALIRTLALEPELLLLDDPFVALDPVTRLEMEAEIGAILKKEGKTALLVTHDIAEAVCMADRVHVLTGRPAAIRTTVDIHFEPQPQGPLAMRAAAAFPGYYNRVWREMHT